MKYFKIISISIILVILLIPNVYAMDSLLSAMSAEANTSSHTRSSETVSEDVNEVSASNTNTISNPDESTNLNNASSVEDSNLNSITTGIETTDSVASPKVSTTTNVSSNQGLTVSDIINIILIAVGVVLILLGIAILIRCK